MKERERAITPVVRPLEWFWSDQETRSSSLRALELTYIQARTKTEKTCLTHGSASPAFEKQSDGLVPEQHTDSDQTLDVKRRKTPLATNPLCYCDQRTKTDRCADAVDEELIHPY